MQPQKPKYITNKDLLREIHLSKTTYCYFEKPEYANFDAIVMSLDSITDEYMQAVAEKKSTPKGKVIPDRVYTPEDLVFRVMTHDHIPLDPDRKRKARNTDKSYARTNFPPFKHYMLRDGSLVEVGRSHWKGDLTTGEFCLDGGYMTPHLASMFMLLVERYSRRGNWRGYCVDERTEALTKSGWLHWDEITESDIIMSYEHGKMKWSKIKSIFRDKFEGNMFRLTSDGFDALVTPGHKFMTHDGLKRVEYLLDDDELIIMGNGEVDGDYHKKTSRTVSKIEFHGGKNTGSLEDPNEPTEYYQGVVWCPETEFGSFVARRNGCVYLTGNTYVDEMRSHALLQLANMALLFDESKSDNPFAFYTTTIRNSFTRVLNLERKNQNIRDELLIVAGVAPSYTRQIENELEYRFPDQPKKRGTPGRKPASATKPAETTPTL